MGPAHLLSLISYYYSPFKSVFLSQIDYLSDIYVYALLAQVFLHNILYVCNPVPKYLALFILLSQCRQFFIQVTLPSHEDDVCSHVKYFYGMLQLFLVI